MELDLSELNALIASPPPAEAGGRAERNAKRRGDRSAEARALELAFAALEILRSRGTICGGELCRVAEYLGYDAQALSTAWNVRAEFDIDVKPYSLDEPIARVIRVE